MRRSDLVTLAFQDASGQLRPGVEADVVIAEIGVNHDGSAGRAWEKNDDQKRKLALKDRMEELARSYAQTHPRAS